MYDLAVPFLLAKGESTCSVTSEATITEINKRLREKVVQYDTSFWRFARDNSEFKCAVEISYFLIFLFAVQ